MWGYKMDVLFFMVFSFIAIALAGHFCLELEVLQDQVKTSEPIKIEQLVYTCEQVAL